MRIEKATLLAVLVLWCTAASATTWSQTTVEDPIDGSECEVHEPASYGSYIYQWPSKYDGVYWPYIDYHWIWTCESSGYISFGNDFAELTDEEVSRIREYLRDDTARSGSDFDRLEAVYKLRNKDDAFWAWFYRVEAAVLTEEADSARRLALDLLEESLSSMDPSFERVQTYFVVGDYYRRFGNFDKAVDYFRKARSADWIDEDGIQHTGSPYIDEMIDERMLLIPGKSLVETEEPQSQLLDTLREDYPELYNDIAIHGASPDDSVVMFLLNRGGTYVLRRGEGETPELIQHAKFISAESITRIAYVGRTFQLWSGSNLELSLSSYP